ncbi:1-acyl-sn-glycerol-3-phosphate acyltransferase [Candidatus Riflebacteria bacterium]
MSRSKVNKIDPNNRFRQIKNDKMRFFIAWLLCRFLVIPLVFLLYRILNRVRIYGIENLRELEGGPFIICPNHTSAFDSWVGVEVVINHPRLLFTMDYYLCVLADLNRLGPDIFKILGVLCGVIPVDRKAGVDQYGLHDTVRILLEKKKKVLPIIYPEGTRSKTGRLSNKFKAGVGWIQAHSQVPVLPLYHCGYNKLPGIGKQLIVAFGKPLYFDEFKEKKELPGTWIKITSIIMDALRALEIKYHPEAIAEQKLLESGKNQYLNTSLHFVPLADIALKENTGKVEYNQDYWNTSLHKLETPIYLVKNENRLGLFETGSAKAKITSPDLKKLKGNPQLISILPGLNIQNLGSKEFQTVHGVRHSYCTAPLPFGISGKQMLSSLATAGFLPFFGSTGLNLGEIKNSLKQIRDRVGNKTFGVGISFVPYDKEREWQLILILIKLGIRHLWVSHYPYPTEALTFFRLNGIKQNSIGAIEPQNFIFARVSHLETVKRFVAHPPKNVVERLWQDGRISEQEKNLSCKIGLSEDIIVHGEGSGLGSNGSLNTLFPQIYQSVKIIQEDLTRNIRIGTSGGLSNPQAISAMFSLGADFVVTGSINQISAEANCSAKVKQMLAKAGSSDTAFVVSADPLEKGNNIQVLKYGTQFSVKANKLAKLYLKYGDLLNLPEKEKKVLEEGFFRCSLETAMNRANLIFKDLQFGENKKNKKESGLLLLFHLYLYESFLWAKEGTKNREMDYQIWVDQSIGSFNMWRNAVFSKSIEDISVTDIAERLLFCSGVLTRLQFLQAQGFEVPFDCYNIKI